MQLRNSIRDSIEAILALRSQPVLSMVRLDMDVPNIEQSFIIDLPRKCSVLQHFVVAFG